jgi:hypothetical protein
MSKMLDDDEVMMGGTIMKSNDAAYIIPIAMILISMVCFISGAFAWGVGLLSVAVLLVILIAVNKKKK